MGRAKTVREFERARLKGDEKTAMEYFSILEKAGIFVPKDRLMNHTGIGSVLYAKRPGDGSAREYAASCQKVLGALPISVSNTQRNGIAPTVLTGASCLSPTEPILSTFSPVNTSTCRTYAILWKKV